MYILFVKRDCGMTRRWEWWCSLALSQYSSPPPPQFLWKRKGDRQPRKWEDFVVAKERGKCTSIIIFSLSLRFSQRTLLNSAENVSFPLTAAVPHQTIHRHYFMEQAARAAEEASSSTITTEWKCCLNNTTPEKNTTVNSLYFFLYKYLRKF